MGQGHYKSSYMRSFPEVGCCQYHAKNEFPLKLQQTKMPESDALGLESEYEYKWLMAYSKANSSDPDRPYMAFQVTRCNH